MGVGLVAASLAAWVVYDLTSGIIDYEHVERAGLVAGSEAFRALANGAMLAAGLAQRRAIAGDAASARA